MNYIKQMQENVEDLKKTNAEQCEVINEFLHYLGSSKFWNDPTIQVSEVQQMLVNIKMALTT